MCTMDSSLWEWVGGKGVSTVSEWNLVCGDEYKRGLVQSVFFIGGLFGEHLPLLSRPAARLDHRISIELHEF